ncbi:MAG: 6-phospho-3-hexuloisomerase [Thermomicrobiales bacterium]
MSSGAADFRALTDAILAENARVLAQIDPAEAGALLAAIGAADRIFLLGEGRSGLAMRMLAMRLMHLGRSAHVVGETTTPPIAPGDLLVACSGSGETAVTALLARQAAAAGATVAAITAVAESRLGRLANLRLLLHTPHKGDSSAAPSIQYGGSLFEQSAMLLGDALFLALTPPNDAAHGFTTAARRHANLE